ncbi:MAG: hypothetical protein AB3X41_10915 [Leptothrix ochracea]|uniref:hypothetical protein n=1 Tax=Leptothrix ochracea TaxID=735331 RepID=UPI0034E26D8E
MLIALDPVPLTLAGLVLPVGEDQQVFRMAVGDVLPDAQALGLVRPAAIDHDLKSNHAAQFGHRAATEGGFASSVWLPLALGRRAIPAEHIHEQVDKIEGAQVLFKAGEVKFGHECCIWNRSSIAYF